MAVKLLSRGDLAEKGIDLNASTLWRKVKAGKFPKPVLIGNRSAWPENEIDAYIAALLSARETEAA